MASTSRATSATEERDISKMHIATYKRNVILYATMMLDTIEGKNGILIKEDEVVDVFYKYLLTNHGLLRRELTQFQHDGSILSQEKFTAIWGHYVFLVTTIRHPIYTPIKVVLEKRVKKIPPQIPFRGISKIGRRISDDLNKNARDLLAVATDGSNISCGVLKFMIAFSRWIAILHDAQLKNDYAAFVADIDQWHDLKRTAELYIALDNERFLVQLLWPGCVEWLTTMDCVTVSLRRERNRRKLFDSLPKIIGEEPQSE